MNEHIHEIPCDSCVHNRVCTVRKCFEETEIKTTHPYIKVILACTEYMRSVLTPKTLNAPYKAESEDAEQI